MQKDKKVKSGTSNRAAKPNQWQFVGGWWWWLVVAAGSIWWRFGGGRVADATMAQYWRGMAQR